MRFISVFLILLLGACGQSGDLYLPGEPAPVPAETPATAVVPGAAVTAPAPAAEEKKPDEERTP